MERVQVTQVAEATPFQATRQQSLPRYEPQVLPLVEPVQATRPQRRQSPPRNEPLVLQQGPPTAFDRGYIYIVSLGDTFVLKIGWSNF